VNVLNSFDQFETSKVNQKHQANDHHLIRAPSSHQGIGLGRLAEIADRELKHLQCRSDFLPKEFCGDAAWSMLLFAFVSEFRGNNCSAAQLYGASAWPSSTATRWLAALEQAGLVVLQGDLPNSPTQKVYLTTGGRHKVASILAMYD
jgi:hypothetical protein